MDWLKEYRKLQEDISCLTFKVNETEYSPDVKKELELKREQMKKLLKLVDMFEGLDQKIMKMKYVYGMTLENIAYELGYQYNYIKRKHAEITKIIKYIDINFNKIKTS